MAFISSLFSKLLVNEEPVYKVADSYQSYFSRFQFGPDSAIVTNKSFPRRRGGTASSDALGINNSILDPYFVVNSTNIKSIHLVVNKACVSQSTVGASPTVRIDIYSTTSTSRTLLSTVRVPLTPSGVGVNGTVATCYQYATLTLITPLNVPAGTLLGVDFVTENSDNNKINGVENMLILLSA